MIGATVSLGVVIVRCLVCGACCCAVYSTNVVVGPLIRRVLLGYRQHYSRAGC